MMLIPGLNIIKKCSKIYGGQICKNKSHLDYLYYLNDSQNLLFLLQSYSKEGKVI